MLGRGEVEKLEVLEMPQKPAISGIHESTRRVKGELKIALRSAKILRFQNCSSCES